MGVGVDPFDQWQTGDEKKLTDKALVPWVGLHASSQKIRRDPKAQEPPNGTLFGNRAIADVTSYYESRWSR